MAGGIKGFRHIGTVPNNLPCGLLHRLIADFAGTVVSTIGAGTAIDLTPAAVADIKSQILMLTQISQHIGAGTGSLSLEGLHRPLASHLIRRDTLDIVFQRKHIDHGQASAGNTFIIKATAILIPTEPGADILFPGNIGQDSQAASLAIIVLEQNTVGPRFHNIDAIGAGTDDLTFTKFIQGLQRFVLGKPCANTNLILPVDPCHESVIIILGSIACIFKRGKCILQTDMEAADLDIAIHICGISIATLFLIITVTQVLGLHNRDGGHIVVGMGQLLKVEILVVIAETESLTVSVCILEIGTGQLPQFVMLGTRGKAHPDHNVAIIVISGRHRRGGHHHRRSKK